MKPEKTVPFVAVARWLRLPATGRSGELQRCRQKGCQGSVVWGGGGYTLDGARRQPNSDRESSRPRGMAICNALCTPEYAGRT